MAKVYELNLIRGIDFYTLEKDFTVLFDNFHPVYYMYDFWGVNVLKKVRTNQRQELHCEFVSFNKVNKQNKRFIVTEIERKRIRSPKGDFLGFIQYSFSMNEFFKKSSKVNVTFQAINDDEIKVTMTDESRWFENQYKDISSNSEHIKRCDRASLARDIGPNKIQYFYREPQAERSKYIPQTHCSLALQGGGVKGISYIGVNSALKTIFNEQKIEIRNIIGSSAGGILGLAICCKMQEKQLLQIVGKLGSIPREDKIGLEQCCDQSELIKKLIQTFIDFGIIDPSLISLASEILSDKIIAKLIIQRFKLYNNQIAQLFIKISENSTEQLTLARLLSGKLMKGQKVEQIACFCLKKQFPHKQQSELKKITFKQLYQKIDTEFTCTSVDLNDQIIRFFNHKTTPNMPVAIAVQMTGSFPVAFERQIWKQSWGKYYIHHFYTKKQKNLVGHEFTDGGMLSNFPIKFLDNQNMRPMYFSHPKTEKTRLYGFGLLLVKDSEVDQKKNKRIQQIPDKITQRIEEIFLKEGRICKLLCGTIASFCKNFFCCSSKTIDIMEQQQTKSFIKNGSNIESQKQINIEENMMGSQSDKKEGDNRGKINFFHKLQQIPLFNFIFKMLSTYIKSDINFQKQCFDQQCYNTAFGKKGKMKNSQEWLKKQYKHDQYTKNIQNISQRMQRIFRKKDNLLKQVLNNIRLNLNIIKENLKKKLLQRKIKEKHILDASRRINGMITLIYSEFTKINNQAACRPKIQKKLAVYMERLDQISQCTFFYRQNILNDTNEIIKLIDRLNSDQLKSQNLSQYKACVQYLAKTQGHFAKIMLINIRLYHSILSKSKERKTFIPIPRASLSSWTYLRSFNFLASSNQIKQIYDKTTQQINIPQLPITQFAFQKRHQIRRYTQRMMMRSLFHLKKERQDLGRNIHIVLESKHISELYFNEYFPIIQNSIRDFNKMKSLNENQMFKIKTITASGYQSLIALLYASKLSRMKINQYVWEIRSAIQVNETIHESFQKYDWTKTNQKIILEIQDEAWKNKFDFLGMTKDLFNKKYKDFSKSKSRNLDQQNYEKARTEFNKEYELHKIQLTNTKQQIMSAFETVINYTSDVLADLNDEETGNFEDRLEKAREKLFLKSGSRNYLKEMNETNKKSKLFYEFMINRFEDFVMYSFHSSSNIEALVMQHIEDEKTRKLAWKGVLLSRTLLSFRLKSLIKEILRQLGLNSNSTLKQFSSIVEQKDMITVNFIAIQSINKKLTVINHNTRPNMPVWAAILATSSLPYMYEPVTDQKSWRSSSKNLGNECFQRYFKETKKNSEYLQSGSMLSRLPLELVTNKKIRELIGSYYNETYLALTFDDFRRSSSLIAQTMKKITTKPLDLYTVISILRYKKNLGQILSIKSVNQRMSELKTYIQSHDNTFLNVYRTESIQLPIRLDTLDFHKVNNQGSSTQISQIAIDCIKDAKYVTLQKIHNTESKPIKSEQNQRNQRNRIIYFKLRKYRYERVKENIDNKNKKQNQKPKQKDKQIKTKLVLQFPSARIEEYFDMKQRYRIFYQIEQNQFSYKIYQKDTQRYIRGQKYRQIKKQTLLISQDYEKLLKENKKLFIRLKIIYVSQYVCGEENPKKTDKKKSIHLLTQLQKQIEENPGFQYLKNRVQNFNYMLGLSKNSEKMLIEQQDYRMYQVYHELNLSQVFKNEDAQFNMVYKLEYDKFYGEAQKNITILQSERFEGEQVKKSIKIKVKSIDIEYWPFRDACMKCGHQPLKEYKPDINRNIPQKSVQCINICSKEAKIIYQCLNCQSKFCIQCGYNIKFYKDYTKCPLGHDIQQDFNKRVISQKRERLHICDRCQIYRPVMYRDEQCNVDICGMCLQRQRLLLN